ncbi:MAG: transcription elongation factor GreA, partial [Phycisphaerales bacterium]|nr:transcription elongation factor GreA [Phycisphaerales bacterium]
MNYITQEEKSQIAARLDQLRARRPEISTRIAEARALGDLRENGDYHAAREEQGLNEAEIRRLEERLATSQVMEAGASGASVVSLGHTVKLKEVDSGDLELYRLVGEATGSASAEIVEVTVSSPMGAALLKARIGEIIRVDAPRRVLRFE